MVYLVIQPKKQQKRNEGFSRKLRLTIHEFVQQAIHCVL